MFYEVCALTKFATSLSNKVVGLGIFSYPFSQIFKINFFTEHFWITACEESNFTRVLFLKELLNHIGKLFLCPPQK